MEPEHKYLLSVYYNYLLKYICLNSFDLIKDFQWYIVKRKLEYSQVERILFKNEVL